MQSGALEISRNFNRGACGEGFAYKIRSSKPKPSYANNLHVLKRTQSLEKASVLALFGETSL